MTWLFIAASYLLGATPTSYLSGRVARGIDLREHGSGNLGATNAFRVLGWKAALPAAIVDVLKGWLPVVLFSRWDGAAPEWALAYGAAAIVGHVFSVYVGFKGGKGVATSAGVLVALAPRAALVGLVIWVLLVATLRIVSVGSMAAAITVPVMVFFTQGAGPVLWLVLALAAFVLFAHRSNIGRLLRGEENRFGSQKGEAT